MPLTTTILTTKLFIPPNSHRQIPRTRLVELLAQGNNYRLILISAPAGFGKTTLVTDWHHSYPKESLSWISLDESDNEPGRFLRYLISAFRDLIPDECEILLSQLERPHPAEIENLLTELLNALTKYSNQLTSNHFYLVLDDYHLIVDETIHKAISLMLEYMPPRMHLIITSRVDPPLPLYRWRARNQLLEIRAADLRFRAEEATTFIAQDSSLIHDLTNEDIILLTNRTEGWAVGLQLAMLWLRGHENSAKAVLDFSGNNRFVLEYLGEEVLARQPETVRAFLLKTSILDRFNLNLANAVTQLEWGEEDLARLEQANLFLIPLDKRGEWYRYHHLFAEFLQYRLKRGEPGQLAELHRRASLWFEQKQHFHMAIEQALAGADYQRACGLIERVAWPIIIRAQVRDLVVWLSKIPEATLYSQPYLCMLACCANNLKGRLTGMDKMLEVAEQGLRQLGQPEKLRDYYHFRMQLARQKNNLVATLEYTELTLSIMPQYSTAYRVVAETAPAGVYLNQGEIYKALPYVNLLYAAMHQKDSFLGQLFTGFILGDLYLLQGQLQMAVEIHEEITKIASAHSIYTILSYVRLANINLEWGNFKQAQEYLNKIEEIRKQIGEFYIPPGYYNYSGLWWADGDNLPTLAWSSASNEEIEKYWNDSYQFQFEALKSRLENRNNGRLDELEKWCETRFPEGYSALARPLEYQLEPQYLSLVRVLIHQNNTAEAISLLEDLQQLAKSQGRTHNLVKIKILTALAHHKASEGSTSAHQLLQEALTLAEQGGYLTVFQEEGAPLKDLLKQLLSILEQASSSLTTYAARILSAFDTVNEPKKGNSPLASPAPTYESLSDMALSEHLSGRELEVLRLVAAGASNREISDQMVISLATVKKHLSNIFDKFDVTSRTQALVRAKELGLI